MPSTQALTGVALTPSTVTIFAQDPALPGKLVTFLLENTSIPSPGRVRLDFIESETHSRTYTPTRSPVRRLSVDQVLRNPDVLVVNGLLAANPLGGPVATALGFAGSFVRNDRRQRDNLLAIAEQRQPVVVVCPDRHYTSMVITNITETHNTTTGNSIPLSLTFEEVVIVDPFLLAGQFAVEAALVGAKASTSVGPAPTKAVSLGSAGSTLPPGVS